jgi:hypothetical protein
VLLCLVLVGDVPCSDLQVLERVVLGSLASPLIVGLVVNRTRLVEDLGTTKFEVFQEPLLSVVEQRLVLRTTAITT